MHPRRLAVRRILSQVTRMEERQDGSVRRGAPVANQEDSRVQMTLPDERIPDSDARDAGVAREEGGDVCKGRRQANASEFTEGLGYGLGPYSVTGILRSLLSPRTPIWPKFTLEETVEYPSLVNLPHVANQRLAWCPLSAVLNWPKDPARPEEPGCVLSYYVWVFRSSGVSFKKLSLSANTGKSTALVPPSIRFGRGGKNGGFAQNERAQPQLRERGCGQGP
ncbi:hypothetical protein B0H16DRAFT_1460268 [Mycena metata]|uniref:Uncharacterized protein n=1 Tax=Mycena metata TaxID=1033252 RepID=A0AAD7N9G7_9AGAR|nr:hypothetical protein B0H16DRAFT_1460268 [Mycena metata]